MKALLLDTHVLIWCLADPDRLSPEVRARIESPDTTVFVSVVTGWEIELKRSLGKIDAPEDLEAQLASRRFTELPLRLRHLAALKELPPLHRDPFDRMLVAQCMTDDLMIVTRDERVLGYPVSSLRVS